MQSLCLGLRGGSLTPRKRHRGIGAPRCPAEPRDRDNNIDKGKVDAFGRPIVGGSGPSKDSRSKLSFVDKLKLLSTFPDDEGDTRESSGSSASTSNSAGSRSPPIYSVDDFDETYWGDWGLEDVDEWGLRETSASAQDYKRYPRGRDARPRYQGTNVPRDAWLKPIADIQGVFDRMTLNPERVEEQLLEEAEANMFESRAAVRFAVVWLVAVPLSLGFCISRFVVDPVLQFDERSNATAFALTDHQKIEGAEEVRRFEYHLRMLQAVGMAPVLSEEETLNELRHEAKEYVHKTRDKNRRALINLISDSISVTVLTVVLIKRSFGRRVLWRTAKRLVGGLSDVAKAFIIILVADTLLGYHSEEGWTGVLNLVTEHYGFETQATQLTLFVGFVPVLLDSMFKYWIFTGLNRVSPEATVTLRQMDRH